MWTSHTFFKPPWQRSNIGACFTFLWRLLPVHLCLRTGSIISRTIFSGVGVNSPYATVNVWFLKLHLDTRTWDPSCALWSQQTRTGHGLLNPCLKIMSLKPPAWPTLSGTICRSDCSCSSLRISSQTMGLSLIDPYGYHWARISATLIPSKWSANRFW